MMRLGRSSVITMLSLLASVAAAYAERAWILWSQGVRDKTAITWFTVGAYPSLNECRTALKDAAGSPQHIVVDLLHHFDIDDLPVAHREGQPTEPAFLQARKDLKQEHRLAGADSLRESHPRAQSIHSHGRHLPHLCLLRSRLRRARFRSVREGLQDLRRSNTKRSTMPWLGEAGSRRSRWPRHAASGRPAEQAHRRARPRPRQGHRDRRLGARLPRRHRPHSPRRGAVKLSPELYQTLMRRFTRPWRRARRVQTA